MVCRCATPAEHAARAEAQSRASEYETTEFYKRTIDRLNAEIVAMTPDPTKYEVLEAQPVNGWLVMKVKFPSCTKCAYEGVKVLVYADVTPIDALKWRKIDPHFRPPYVPVVKNAKAPLNEAPSPTARFPGSPEGWTDALAYVTIKTAKK